MERQASLDLLAMQIEIATFFEAVHEFLTMPPKVDPEKVLPTELFEMGLLNLPLVDLVRAQRASKNWRMALGGSIKIQQALFTKPYPAQGVDCVFEEGKWWTRDRQTGHHTQIQPLLNPFAMDCMSGKMWRPPSPDDYVRYAALKNFALNPAANTWYMDLWYDRCTTHTNDPDVFKFSIQRMLPVQPAVPHLICMCPDRVHPPDDEDFFDEYLEDGVDSGEDNSEVCNTEYDNNNGGMRSLNTEEDSGASKTTGDGGLTEEEAAVQYPYFLIKPHGASSGFVRIGDMINDCWYHWMRCREDCNCIEEIEEWRWKGDDDVEWPQRGVEEITGYEVLAKLKERFG